LLARGFGAQQQQRDFYEALEIDTNGMPLEGFRTINPVDQLLNELVPLQATLHFEVADLLKMQHGNVNTANLRGLFHSTAMHMLFLKKPEQVKQNILYGAEDMPVEDILQADEMLHRMMVKAGRPDGVGDGVELRGVRFQTREVVEEAQSRGVERPGGGSDHWHGMCVYRVPSDFRFQSST
jgi:hypothetical protein